MSSGNKSKKSLGKSPLKPRPKKSSKTQSQQQSSSGQYPKIVVLPPKTLDYTHPAQHFGKEVMYFGFQQQIEIEAEDGSKTRKIVNCLVSNKGEVIPCIESELKKKGITLIAPPLVTKKEGNRISDVVLHEWQRTGGRKPDAWGLDEYLEFVVSTMKELVDFTNPDYFYYLALWNLGSYCHRLFETYPYQYYNGPTGTGKTRTLEVLEKIGFNARLSPDMSPPSLFRTVESLAPMLLIDETEDIKNAEKTADFRKMVLSGYKAGSAVMRAESVKDGGFAVDTFGTYSPKAFANISGMDDILSGRCVKNLMQKSKKESVMTARIMTTVRKIKYQQIRDQSYLIIYNYWERIKELTKEHADKEVVEGVTGRNLELWNPIFVLAKLFEENGCPDLFDVMTKIALKQVEAALEAFRDSNEGQVIRAMREMMVDNNLQNQYYEFQTLMPFIAEQATFVEQGIEIDKETGEEIQTSKIKKPRWLTPRWLTEKLKLLGIDDFRGYGGGRKFNLCKEKMIDLWERYMGTWEAPEMQSGLVEFGCANDINTQDPNEIVLDEKKSEEEDIELIMLNMSDKKYTFTTLRDKIVGVGWEKARFEERFKKMIEEGYVIPSGKTPVYYKAVPRDIGDEEK